MERNERNAPLCGGGQAERSSPAGPGRSPAKRTDPNVDLAAGPARGLPLEFRARVVAEKLRNILTGSKSMALKRKTRGES